MVWSARVNTASATFLNSAKAGVKKPPEATSASSLGQKSAEGATATLRRVKLGEIWKPERPKKRRNRLHL